MLDGHRLFHTRVTRTHQLTILLEYIDWIPDKFSISRGLSQTGTCPPWLRHCAFDSYMNQCIFKLVSLSFLGNVFEKSLSKLAALVIVRIYVGLQLFYALVSPLT